VPVGRDERVLVKKNAKRRDNGQGGEKVGGMGGLTQGGEKWGNV